MLVQVNGNGLEKEAGGLPAIEADIRRRLNRFENRLTRVEIYFEDVNADRGGACDKRCVMELRPERAAPIAVSDCADRVRPAIAGASAKAVAALDSHFGKVASRR